MDSGFYAAFTGLAAETQALELAANNLANISTTGYKAQREFYKSLTASLGNTSPRPLSSLNQAINNYGVLGGATLDVQAGMMERTGNDLDLAMEGSGFFVIQTKAGLKYTRNGNFRVDTEGQVRTAWGDPVMDDQNRPLEIPSGPISVSTDGTISSQGGVVGRFQTVDFAPRTALAPEGNSLYSAPKGTATPATDPRVRQGMLERSNIDVVQEFAVLALFLVPSLMGAAGSLQPRIRIPKFAEVQGETIRLSDLLPPDAPADLEQIGARIALGDSPDPACQRVLSKDQIELQLREFPSIWERLELPERLIVSCKQRRLSPDEIWTVIESFLAGEGLSATGAVPQRLPSYQATVFVTKQDPGLEVKRMEPDRVRRQIRFLLWTSNEPQVLPFYVTVEEPPRTAGRSWSSHADAGPAANLAVNPEGLWKAEEESFAGLLIGSRSGVPVYKAGLTPPVASPAIILVTKGKPAKLVVETQTLSMTALVTPLEPGAQGQVIRVRNLDTQRVFKAEVVGKGLLQAELAGE